MLQEGMKLKDRTGTFSYMAPEVISAGQEIKQGQDQDSDDTSIVTYD